MLVDASNAFNSINRNAFLHNITIICPPQARYVRNCYYAKTQLIIIRRGNPTTMAICAIAIIPLILMIVGEANQVDNTTKTAAYADDISATGTIMRLMNWW